MIAEGQQAGVGTNDNAVQPVKQLAETAAALEAAVLDCLAKPKIKAVHKVRTMTRRIEAQLTLLPLIGGFPPYEKHAEKVRSLLKKLRRAAGAVRDLDVQQDLIAKEAEAVDGDGAREIQKEARKLERQLKKRREAEAEKLLGLLKSVKPKLPKRLKGLFDTLEPAEERNLREAELLAKIRDWYRAETEPYLEATAKDPDDPDQLHSVRKAAKLARYLAETISDGASRAQEVAGQFEQIQEAGGQWHDWMILSELAASELGESAALPQRFAMHAADALADFRQRIA